MRRRRLQHTRVFSNAIRLCIPQFRSRHVQLSTSLVSLVVVRIRDAELHLMYYNLWNICKVRGHYFFRLFLITQATKDKVEFKIHC